MSVGVTVIKIGGSTLGQHDTSLDDIAALHAQGRGIVVVHGGGATVSDWLEKHGVRSRFRRGLRVTDAAALEVVVAVLAGLVNKRLVAELQARGAPAFGLSGADGALLRVRRYDPELGYVGEIIGVDAAGLRSLVEEGRVAVLAPIAVEADDGGTIHPQLLNVNADTVAGEVAAALPAEELIFLTDVPGVADETGAARSCLTATEARQLLTTGAVSGGMIPKVEAALRAAAVGVPTTIADGRVTGALRSVAVATPGGPEASQNGTTIT